MVFALLLAALLAIQPSSTIQHTKESIVLIKWHDTKTDETSVCTGFAVGLTWVATAGHCLPEDDKIEILVDGIPSHVIKHDKRFALLDVPLGKYPVLRLRKGRPAVGDEVTTFGYAYGLPLMTLKRHVAAWCGCDYADTDHLMMDGEIGNGMSGGPVIDVNGELVGMNQAGMRDDNGSPITLSIACPAEELRDFMNGK